MKPVVARRHGVTSLLAMIYLIIFSALAIGFYTSTTTAVLVANNEKKITLSHTAAEGGAEFIRYQLAAIDVPPGTPDDEIFSHVADQLKTALEGTGNLGANTVAVSSTTITIPAEPDQYIKLDSSGAEFQAHLEKIGDSIRAKMIGRHGNTLARRAIQIDYERTEKPTTVFNYAVASKGKVVMQKGAIGGVAGVSPDSIASIMSAKGSVPAIYVSGGAIGGRLSITAPGLATVTGGSVNGASNPATILATKVDVVEPPEFPVVDTDVFRQYAVNMYSGSSTMKNVRIPAGANPRFTGGATIQGILYIESPNTVDFRGNVELQGFIVFENKGTTGQNVIDMRGNFSHLPLPSGAEFDALRDIKGIAVLAPTTSMVISGSVDSILDGNIILGTFNNGGSADWIIHNGSLLTLDTSVASTVFNGKTVRFGSTGGNNIPTAGLVYSSYFKPDATTYEEVIP